MVIRHGTNSLVFFLLFSGLIILNISTLVHAQSRGIDPFFKIDGIDGEPATASVAHICDGVTCPDGSCAATRDECTAVTAPADDSRVAPDPIAAPDMSTGDDDAEARPTTDRPDYLDPDDDGDGIPTREDSIVTPIAAPVPIRDEVPERTPETPPRPVDEVGTLPVESAVSAQDYNSSRSNKRGGEVGDDIVLDDADESDVIRPAKNYNSSRSNRRKNTFFDPTDDAAEEAEDDDANVITVRQGTVIRASEMARDMRCGSIAAGRDDGGSLWCWGSGARAVAVGEANEDGSLATSTRVLQNLSVRGNEVRSWSEQERAEFRRFQALTQDSVTPETTAARIVDKTLEDTRIETLEIDGPTVHLRYRATLRLFGFIPLERTIDATLADTGEPSITYPWYAFLATKPDRPTINQTLLDTMAILVRVPA